MKQNSNVWIFMLVAYGFTWLFWGSEALIARGIWNAPEGVRNFLAGPFNLGPYGPLFAAIAVTFMYQGGAGVKDLLKRGLMVRLGKWWWVALLPFPVLIGGSLAVSVLLGNHAPEFEALGQPRALPIALVCGDGSFQHGAFHFAGLGQLSIDLFPAPGRFYESRLNGRYPRQRYEGGGPLEIDTPLGAVMFLRREAIQRVGLFDEEFALYCEEIDWAARFKEAGWKNLCAPAAHIVHYEGRSTSQVRVESFVKLWTSRHRLHTKHPQFAPLWLARRIVVAGMKRKRRMLRQR